MQKSPFFVNSYIHVLHDHVNWYINKQLITIVVFTSTYLIKRNVLLRNKTIYKLKKHGCFSNSWLSFFQSYEKTLSNKPRKNFNPPTFYVRGGGFYYFTVSVEKYYYYRIERAFMLSEYLHL